MLKSGTTNYSKKNSTNSYFKSGLIYPNFGNFYNNFALSVCNEI